MVPPQNLYSQQYYQDYYGDDHHGFMSRVGGYEESSCNEACLGSDIVIGPLIMAEDESRTSSVNEEDQGGSTSKDNRDDRTWLQLGLSTGDPELNLDRVEPITARSRGGLVELDLLPGSSTSISSHSQHLMMPLASSFQYATELQRAPHHQLASTNGNSIGATSSTSPTPLFLQQYPIRTSFNFPHQAQPEITWGSYNRPNINPWDSMAASSSSSLLPPLGSYYPRTFHHPSMGMGGTGSDIRVVDAPRRPHSGIWFVLQASQNQAKEPFLPQIPKNYLRIKDGRMTVRVLMKYLANKLRLDSESEVEITCRGQQLLPYLTLQHVRDNIWNITREVNNIVTLLPHSSTTDHIMVLHYGRSNIA